MSIRTSILLLTLLSLMVVALLFGLHPTPSHARVSGSYGNYLALVQGGGGDISSPTPTVEPSATATINPNATATATATSHPTSSPTEGPSPTVGASPTEGPSPTTEPSPTTGASSTPDVSPTPTASATPSPQPTSSPTPSAPPAWLTYLNMRRANGGLLPVTENPAWSYGNQLHGRYMVKNDVIGHSEDPNNEWYTEEGNAAAQASNVIVSTSTQFSHENAIDGWLVGPFHAVGILDPQLLQSGYGDYREADGGWQFGGGLDVLRGTGAVPPSVTFPIRYPKTNGSTDITAYGGGESPDPLSSCPGYSVPTGAPIYLMIGAGDQSPQVTATALLRDGVPVEHCFYEENTYTHPNGDQQALGRSVLGARDAVVLIPRNPLTIGSTYTVSITVNGSVETWDFTVVARSTVTPPESQIR